MQEFKVPISHLKEVWKHIAVGVRDTNTSFRAVCNFKPPGSGQKGALMLHTHHLIQVSNDICRYGEHYPWRYVGIRPKNAQYYGYGEMGSECQLAFDNKDKYDDEISPTWCTAIAGIAPYTMELFNSKTLVISAFGTWVNNEVIYLRRSDLV